MRRYRFARRLAGACALLLAAATGRGQDVPGSGPSNIKISTQGRQVYEQVCQACHMADAKGSRSGAGTIPGLANNPRLEDPKYPIAILLNGRGGMPWFTDILSPAQMAAVISFVRSNFNKYTDPVTEEDVKKISSKISEAAN